MEWGEMKIKSFFKNLFYCVIFYIVGELSVHLFQEWIITINLKLITDRLR